jgi:hypothetical protein
MPSTSFLRRAIIARAGASADLGDADVVVVGEPAHNIGRRIGSRRNPPGKRHAVLPFLFTGDRLPLPEQPLQRVQEELYSTRPIITDTS